jgi:CNP1-like family
MSERTPFLQSLAMAGRAIPRIVLSALLGACSSGPVNAPPAIDDDDVAARGRWNELNPHLPPYPREQNLLPFEVGGASANRFYIDSASISPGEDGVIRYTLVVKSPQGATNVSFEGMRCTTRELKRYAFGRGDGTWAKSRDEAWRPIVYQDSNPHHAVLYRDFFCPDLVPVRSQREAVDALKSGGHPRAFKFPG